MNGEFPDHLDLEKLVPFIHNSLIGIRVLSKITDDKRNCKTTLLPL
jgi:TetR/AcrR family transcriptional regulator, transcriptional repressor for nem operon